MGGLTMESASYWYFFLAEEADFEGDMDKCKAYLSKAEALGQFQGSVIDNDLEYVIKKWRVNT
jgi:hypothetical protein